MELTGGTYDEAGNLIARTEDTGDLALAQFTYDGIDRLDTADGAFGSRDYDLDRNGNRNKLVSDGVTTTFTYPRNRYRKHDNQPTRDTFWTYTHDANGSITAKTSTVGAPDLGYEYDAHNRLIRTTSDDGTVMILGEYAYNGLGQRVRKDSGGEVFEYRYGLAGELLAVLDSAGQPVREFVYLNSQPLAVVDHGADAFYYVHNDQLGTPRALSDETGARVWTAIYDPFGAASVDEDPDQDGIPVTLNLRFPGQYYDQETGLHYNYFRTYDPSTGRYLESDPIGLAGGLNTYGYVNQNPLSFADPTGEVPILIPIIVGIGILADIYDAADTANTLLDQCATPGEKTIAAGLFALGILDPTPGNLGKRGLKPLVDQAADLVPLNNGLNRLTLRSPSVKLEVDLAGRAHGGVPTPHTKVSPRNPAAPNQPAYNTKSSPVSPTTQQEIRLIRKYLERQ